MSELDRPPHLLSSRVTGLCATVLAVFVGWLFFPSPPATPLTELQQPERSLERLASRELDYRDALKRAPVWEQATYRAITGAQDPLADLTAWFDELISVSDAPRARLYRAILLAEGGPAGAVDRDAGPADPDQRMDPGEDWLYAAYGETAPSRDAGQRIIADIRESLPSGWFVDTLVARIASQIGDSRTAQDTATTAATRARTLLWRWRILTASGLAVLVLSAVGSGWLLARRASPRIAEARLPPPWTNRDGYGLFIRSAVGLLATGLLAGVLIPSEAVAENVSTVVGAVPMLWWTTRCLQARDASFAETFGIIPRAGTGVRLLTATLVLIGLSIAAETLIAVGARALGIREHWTEGFQEELLWASPAAAAAIALAAVLWNPAVEELAFRGILYATLRSTIGVWPAAAVSGAVFAFGHGYGVVGFVAVFWSGTLWALSYEWTRSLLPAMLAHAANNLIVTVAFVWLIRLE
jgi:membrane protease YdiL (CAAX protease family)